MVLKHAEDGVGTMMKTVLEPFATWTL